MSVTLDEQIDELVNPHPKRFSQCYEPSRNVKQAIEAADKLGWTWTLSSRGLASVWYTENGEQCQSRAEADTPAKAMCVAIMQAWASAKGISYLDLENHLPPGERLSIVKGGFLTKVPAPVVEEETTGSMKT